MIANHFTTPEIVLILSPRAGGVKTRGEKRNEESGTAQAVKSAPPEGLSGGRLGGGGGQTCIPAAVQQLQLTSIRPPLAPLPHRFLLSRHATPNNYGRLTPNRLDCDLKLRFIFLCECMRVCFFSSRERGGGEVLREHFNHQICLSDANWLSLFTMCLI